MLESLYETDEEKEEEKLYTVTFEPQFLRDSTRILPQGVSEAAPRRRRPHLAPPTRAAASARSATAAAPLSPS